MVGNNNGAKNAPRNQQLHFETQEGGTPVQHQPATGAFKFFNPTHAHLSIPLDHNNNTGNNNTSEQVDSNDDKPDTESPADSTTNLPPATHHKDVHYYWRSRDNRKGRHALVVDPNAPGDNYPASTKKLTQVFKVIGWMCYKYNWFDVSWIVAVLFTIGSVIWCVNAFFSWLPQEIPSSYFHGEAGAGGWTAFWGATVFEVGSVFLMIEALNESHTACFGWAFEEKVEEEERKFEGDVEKGGPRGEFHAVPEECSHHHQKGRIMRKNGPHNCPPQSPMPSKPDDPYPSWVWWPTWHSLTTHYFHQIGFWACFAQFWGATIFWISGFTAIPRVIDMDKTTLTNWVFWTPQVVGGTGFIISSTLFMLETQKKWWRPQLDVLGWHIGFWNLIGALGFTLCGALGYADKNKGAVYESDLATFWGSWAFLIGSLLQWYEAMNKFPVIVQTPRP